MKKPLAVLFAILSAGPAFAEGEGPRQVVPYCESAIEHMCEIFVEYLDRDPRFEIVPHEERWPNTSFLNLELRAHWNGGSELEGRIVWWGKSGEEHVGVGAVMRGVPQDPKVYIHMISLSLSGAGLPEKGSPFYNYGH